MYFGEETMPIRLCYAGNIFINNNSYQGRLKESTQLGAELIGDDSIEADAEILAMAVECLKKAGLEKFQISIGHAGFMCVGAFSSAFCTKLLQDSIQNEVILFLIAIAVGTIAAAFFGFLIGIPVLRLRGDYLAIVTLAFGEIIKNVINVLYIAKDENGFHFAISDGNKIELSEDGIWLINGAKGIAKIPHLSSFTAGVIMILVILFIVYNFVNSRTGRAIMSIRDNRIAAESIGINITKYKLLAFSISAALAGVAGVLYAHNLTTLTALPKNFGYNMSIMILVYVVLGGIGSIRGSVISTVILYLLPELLRGLNNYRMLIYAIVLILAMLFNSAPQFITLRKRIFDGLKPQHAAHSGKEEA